MKVFLIVVVVLAAVVYGAPQNDKEEREEAIGTELVDEEDAVDADDQDKRAKKAKEYFKGMGSRVKESLEDSKDAPEDLKSMARNMGNNDDLFRFEHNKEVKDAQILKNIGKDCAKYLKCDSVKYYLYWFYYKNQFCYIPWAWRHGATYVRCKCPTCLVPNTPFWKQHESRCFRSCYEPRRFFVYCYNHKMNTWSWGFVVRRLAQSCQCSFHRSIKKAKSESAVAADGN